MAEGLKRPTVNAKGCGFDTQSVTVVMIQSATLSSVTKQKEPNRIRRIVETVVFLLKQSVLTLGF